MAGDTIPAGGHLNHPTPGSAGLIEQALEYHRRVGCGITKSAGIGHVPSGNCRGGQPEEKEDQESA